MTIKVTTIALFSAIAALLAALMSLSSGNIAASVAFFLSAAVHFISYLVIKYEQIKESGENKNVPGP